MGNLIRRAGRAYRPDLAAGGGQQQHGQRRSAGTPSSPAGGAAWSLIVPHASFAFHSAAMAATFAGAVPPKEVRDRTEAETDNTP